MPKRFSPARRARFTRNIDFLVEQARKGDYESAAFIGDVVGVFLRAKRAQELPDSAIHFIANALRDIAVHYKDPRIVFNIKRDEHKRAKAKNLRKNSIYHSLRKHIEKHGKYRPAIAATMAETGASEKAVKDVYRDNKWLSMFLHSKG